MVPTKKTPNRPRKAAKAPVLNLKATEVKSNEKKPVKTEKPAVKQDNNSTAKKSVDPSPNASKQKPDNAATSKNNNEKKVLTKKPSGKRAIALISLAALIAAGLGGAWAFKTYGSKYFANPEIVTSSQLATAIARIEKLEATNNENQQNAQEIIEQKKLIKTLNSQFTQSHEMLVANTKKLGALEKTATQIRVALAKAVEDNNGPVAVANELQFQQLSQKLSQFEQSLQNLKSVPTNETTNQIKEMQTRLDALVIRQAATEKQTQATSKSIGIVKSAQEKIINSPGSNPASELARAFTILRAQVTQGMPFEKTLNNIAGTLPQETSLDTLRLYAITGAPTIDKLKSTLNKVTFTNTNNGKDKIAETEADIFSAVTDRLSGLVKVTKVGETDWPALKQKAREALDTGNLGNAIDILSKDAAAPEGIKKWLALAKQKTHVDEAVNRLSQTVMSQLTSSTN